MMGNWVFRSSFSDDTFKGITPPILISGVEKNTLGCAIQDLISGSKKGDELLIITPMLEDEETVEALLAASARNARIKLITRLAEHRDGKVTFITKGKIHIDNPKTHEHATHRLTEAGIQIRSLDCLPHVKLVLAPTRALILSSANLASNSLGNSKNAALEAGIFFCDSDTLLLWMHTFKALWLTCSYVQHLSGKMISIQSIPAHQRHAFSLHLSTLCGANEIWWSHPHICNDLTRRLSEAIASAKESILFVALSFYEIDQIPEFEQLLMDALGRHVKVKVVVRPEQFQLSQYPDSSTRRLIQAGLELYGYSRLHAKGFLIDNRLCGITSANFNPYSLDTYGKASNLELALHGQTDTQPMNQFAFYLQTLVTCATHQFMLDA